MHMHIDPKAPADSPQHPRNWRKATFLAPGADVADVTAVAEQPAEPATPPAEKPAPKKSAKKVTHRAKPDLAAALAKLGDQ